MFAADPGEIADAMTELLQKVSETVAVKGGFGVMPVT